MIRRLLRVLRVLWLARFRPPPVIEMPAPLWTEEDERREMAQFDEQLRRARCVQEVRRTGDWIENHHGYPKAMRAGSSEQVACNAVEEELLGNLGYTVV